MTTRRARWIQAGAVFVFIWTLTTHGKPSISGDEPHYLLIAESLVADRDLDLENNYANDSARWFGSGESDSAGHTQRNPRGSLWSAHDIGVPLALLPIYAVTTRAAAGAPVDTLARFRQTPGRLAYSLISLTIAALVTWATMLVTSGLRRIVSSRIAVAVGVGLALTPPVLSHAFLVFPEPLAFAIVAGGVWAMCLREDEMDVNGWRLGLLLAAIGMLPWLHRKYSLLFFGLIWIIVHAHRAWFARLPRRTLVSFACLAILPHAALHAWTLWGWGSLGGPQLARGGSPFQLSFLPEGALGLLIDRESGLAAYGPLYLIVPACLALTWRETRALLVPIALLYLPMAAYFDWRAGYAPAARYLMPLTPLLAVPVARALNLNRPVIVRAAVVLAVFQASITAYVWQNPRSLWPKFEGWNLATGKIPIVGPLYERALPSFLLDGAFTHAAVTIVVITVVTASLVWIARGRAPTIT